MVASNLWCSCLSIPVLSQHFHSFVLQTFMACVEHSRPRKYRNRQSTALILRNLPPSRLLGKSLVKVLCCKGKWAEQLQVCSGTFDSVLNGKNTYWESALYPAQSVLSHLALKHIPGNQVMGEEPKVEGCWQHLLSSRLYLPAVSSCSRESKWPGTDSSKR